MKTAKIDNVRKNVMGTTSFDMKAGRMRKAQDFIVYPIEKGSSAKIIKIQSDRYWAEINLDSGEGELSKGRNNANSWSFSHDQAHGETTAFKITDLDAQALRMQIFTSTNKKAGNNGIVYTDNSGAAAAL